MVFRIRYGKGFSNEGETYNAQVVERKINGWKVLSPEGNITFVCFDDIEILEYTDEEKKMPIAW